MPLCASINGFFRPCLGPTNWLRPFSRAPLGPKPHDEHNYLEDFKSKHYAELGPINPLPFTNTMKKKEG